MALWLSKEEMPFLSTTSRSQSKLPLQPLFCMSSLVFLPNNNNNTNAQNARRDHAACVAMVHINFMRARMPSNKANSLKRCRCIYGPGSFQTVHTSCGD